MSDLVFRHGSEELMRISLVEMAYQLGRGPDNDVDVPDASVSRNQCRLERRGSKWWLVDLSGKGTVLDGRPVQEGELPLGSRISLGPWVAELKAARVCSEAVTLSEGQGPLTRPQKLLEKATETSPELRLRFRTAHGPRVMRLGRSLFSIGSDPQSDLQLSDPFVSRHHAALQCREGRYWLTDAGSTNGTFLNGTLVREAEVKDGSSLRVGETQLWLEAVPAMGAGEAEPKDPPGCFGMVGQDPAMGQVFDLVRMVAPAHASVIVLGETGTGKELVARAIHGNSPRKDKPFVALNSSVMTDTLIESKLFGHEKGAFTGAERAYAGAFEQADGGTLFLDELGEMPLSMQAKLLRALEQGEVQRVGSEKVRLVNVRVVAATHQNLRKLVEQGLFREDLYYRLAVFPITLPPLRRRRSDILPLCEHFLARYRPEKPTTLSAGAQKKLLSHNFPGNVRELRNLIERACMLSGGRPVIEEGEIRLDDQGEYLESAAEAEPGEGGPAENPMPASFVKPAGGEDDYHLYLGGDRDWDELRAELVVRVVRQHKSRAKAARVLGLNRNLVSQICQKGPDRWRQQRAAAALKRKGKGEPEEGEAGDDE